MRIRRQSEFIRYTDDELTDEEWVAMKKAAAFIKKPENRTAVLITADPDWNENLLPKK